MPDLEQAAEGTSEQGHAKDRYFVRFTRAQRYSACGAVLYVSGAGGDGVSAALQPELSGRAVCQRRGRIRRDSLLS